MLFLISFAYPLQNINASEREELSVKLVDNEKYGRIFFYCDQPVQFDVSIEGDLLKVKFDRNFKPNETFAEITKSFKNYVLSTSVSEKGDIFYLKLTGSNYGFRRFVGDNFVGLDLVKPSKPKEHSISGKLPLQKISESVKNGIPDTGKEVEKGDERLVAKVQSDEIRVPEDNHNDNKNLAQKDKDKRENENNQISPDISELKLIKSKIRPQKDHQRKSLLKEKNQIIFEWQNDVSSAVFVRGEYLWVVFDKYKKVSLNDLIKGNIEKYIDFEQSEQLKNKLYSILRFKIKNEFSAKVRKKDFNWILKIDELGVLKAEDEFKLSTISNQLTGTKVQIYTNQKVKLLRVNDPEIGDEIVIIPSKYGGKALLQNRVYTDFIALKTLQGLSVQIISDYVKIETFEDFIEISGPTNKLETDIENSVSSITSNQEKEKKRLARLKEIIEKDKFDLVKFRTWNLENSNAYQVDRRAIEDKIMQAKYDDKYHYRLKLAQFFIVKKLYPEALSVIEAIKYNDEEKYKLNEAKFLEIVSLYFMERYKDALKVYESLDLSKFSVKELEEANFWKSAIDINIYNKIKIDEFLVSSLSQNNLQEAAKKDSSKPSSVRSSRLLSVIKSIDSNDVVDGSNELLEKGEPLLSEEKYSELIGTMGNSVAQDKFEVKHDNLWWGVEKKRNKDLERIGFIENKNSFLKNYPSYIYNDFALLTLEDLLKRNDLEEAEKIINILREEDRFDVQNSIKFFKGLFLVKSDGKEEAFKLWEEILDGYKDRYNRARAKFAMTVFMIDNNEINNEEAIEKLNSIRPVWKGGILEFHILKLLGELYMKEEKYMEGFSVQREAINAFPGSNQALLIAKAMSDKFIEIFAQNEEDELDDLEAVKLFYEFRELTPIGKLGDEIVSLIINRLISLDLLERAISLLSHQVDFRLVGNQKDDATSKLIDIYLMRNELQKALDVINESMNRNIPDDLALERKYIKASILTNLGKNNHVLKLLKGDYSRRAAFLRSDVFWKNKVWRKVVQELEHYFHQMRREGKMLDDTSIEQLIHLSLSYAMIGRKNSVEILHDDFYNLIKDKSKRDIFTFIALDKGPIDFRNLSDTIGIKDIQGFMNDYIELKNNR